MSNAIAYVVIVHTSPTSKEILEVSGKSKAHTEGKRLRAEGKVVYVHAKADAIRFGLMR